MIIYRDLVISEGSYRFPLWSFSNVPLVNVGILLMISSNSGTKMNNLVILIVSKHK